MVIRTIGPEDEARYRELLTSLTQRDRYLRFFHIVRRIGSAEVIPFVTPSDDIVGLIAEEDGLALGAAHAFIGTDGVAEFAIEVRPDHRHRGIGGRLLRELLDELRRRGVRDVVAHSLFENEEFKQLAQEAHMCGEWEDGGTTRWRLRLPSETVSRDLPIFRKPMRQTG